MPVTTPMPKDRANTFSQKSKTRRYTGSPVPSRIPSIVASHAARPIVKEGKIMWKLMTNANWIRDSNNGSRSMALSDLSPHRLVASPSTPRIAIFALLIFGGHGGRYVAGRHRDFLRAVHRVSDHPAADCTVDLLAPQLVAGRRV